MKHKIIIFINSLSTGGAERVVSHLLEHMKNDFEIHLALYNTAVGYNVPPEIKILDLKQKMKESGLAVFLKMPMLSLRLYRYCKANGINTSIAFLNRPCYINALMRTLWGYKGNIIMCERTHQTTLLEHSSVLYRNISRALVKFAYKRADTIVANSYTMQADLLENFKVTAPIQVIHNPIDYKHILAESQKTVQFKFDENVFHFISVGGFRKEKNLELLINAFYILKHLPVKLLIAGNGVLEDKIRQKVADLGLKDKVAFLGFDPNPYKYMRQSDCFVLSSYVEGFPNVLLEALACGMPIVSTDCKSGPREILAPSTDIHHTAITSYENAEFGVLTPVHDVTNLAAAMENIYQDSELRNTYKEKATHRAETFDIEKIKQYFHVVFSS